MLLPIRPAHPLLRELAAVRDWWPHHVSMPLEGMYRSMDLHQAPGPQGSDDAQDGRWTS